MIDYRLNWSLVTDNLDRLLAGLWILVQVAAVGYAMAVGLGLVLALLRRSRLPLFSAPARIYIEVLRGIPLFLFLFLVYYGAPQVTPIVPPPFTAAVAALGLTGAAYAAEIFRGAIIGVDDGQWEGATALGLTPFQRFRDVIGPQALRIALPPSMNLLVALLKGATFVSVIGVADLFYVSRDISLRYFAPFEVYTAAGLTVIGITLMLATLATRVEIRLGRGGQVSR